MPHLSSLLASGMRQVVHENRPTLGCHRATLILNSGRTNLGGKLPPGVRQRATLRRSVRFVGLGSLVAMLACGGQSGSTNQMPSSPAPPATRFRVRGVVRETIPTPTPVLPGVSVEFAGDVEHARTVSDQNGVFTFQGVSVQSAIVRAALDGYETESKTLTVAEDTTVDFALGHAWPHEMRSMLERVPVVIGLKFKRAPGSGPSHYLTSPPVAVFVTPSPVHGELGAIAHEICHSHQFRAAGDANTSDWYATPEGRAYVSATGWTQPSGTWQRPACENGGNGCLGTGCGYPNPFEENAQVCAAWYNPGNVFYADPRELERCPIQFAWARQWLPR
jgi:hypothetical protein